eukprot:9382908-Prorocentrum_lima.AAC.1
MTHNVWCPPRVLKQATAECVFRALAADHIAQLRQRPPSLCSACCLHEHRGRRGQWEAAAA